MIEIELRYNRDQVLRRLAECIIVEQRQEITVMHQATAALSPSDCRQTLPWPLIGMPGMQHLTPKVP